VYITRIKYDKFNTFKKYTYSIIHHPLILFIVIPNIYFYILQRVFYVYKKIQYPLKIKESYTIILINHIINNLGILIYYRILSQFDLIYSCFLLNFVPSSIGFYLFFNQHTFNIPYVVNNETWNMKDSGLKGSSFIQIPKYFKYFTGGIEYHHIHHINSKIPGYNLKKYHDEVISKSNIFDNIVKLTINDSYNNLWLILYDDEKKIYIEEPNKIFMKYINLIFGMTFLIINYLI
jgi:omega-6 fatty acid desaturase (delta-12 desaturase)